MKEKGGRMEIFLLLLKLPHLQHREKMPLPTEELSTFKEVQASTRACKSGAKNCSWKRIKVFHKRKIPWCTGFSISGSAMSNAMFQHFLWQEFSAHCNLSCYQTESTQIHRGKNALLKNYHLMAACGFGPIVPSGNWQPFWVRLALPWVTTEECSVVERMTRK